MAGKTPLVSVIMASYNHERYVGRAVQSVLGQTLGDFEFVITDDASSDGTVDEIARVRDPRIRLLRLPKNRGQFVATNRCLGEATGKYIAVLNSDDMFLPTRLEAQVAFLEEHPEVGAVFSRVRMVDEQDRVLHGLKMFLAENKSRFQWLNWFFYRGNCLCHPSVLIRRQCHQEIGNYDERYAQLADYDLWIRLCLRHEIYVMPQELVAFRVLPQDANMSSERPESIQRGCWEERHILDNYLSVDNPALLLRVFPEAEKYGDRVPAELIPFVLALLALEAKHGKRTRRAFALDTVFRLLGDPRTAAALSQQFGFDARDFIRWTGQYDIFNIFAGRQRRSRRRGRLRQLWKRLLPGPAGP